MWQAIVWLKLTLAWAAVRLLSSGGHHLDPRLRNRRSRCGNHHRRFSNGEGMPIHYPTCLHSVGKVKGYGNGVASGHIHIDLLFLTVLGTRGIQCDAESVLRPVQKLTLRSPTIAVRPCPRDGHCQRMWWKDSLMMGRWEEHVWKPDKLLIRESTFKHSASRLAEEIWPQYILK